MKSNILKIISFFLVMTLILSVFVSCADDNKADTPITIDNGGKSGADAADNQGEESASVTAEARIEPDLPDMDFEGCTFTFLTAIYDSDDWRSPAPLEIVAEIEDTDNPINDAVYKRNMAVTEKYNFNIKMISDENETPLLKKAVGAGDAIYDAAVMLNTNVPTVVTGGLLTNVADLPYIDLSKPWWDPAVNSMSVDNKNYLMAGDLLILDKEATNVILFNKDLLKDTGMALPYDSAKEGKWTMDVFNGYIKGSSRDLNGDGAMSIYDDQWGFVCFLDTFLAMYVSGGGSLALKDENDIPYMNITSPRNLTVADKVMDVMYNKNDVYNVQGEINDWTKWSGAFYPAFEEGRALFQWARMRVVEKYRGIESDFGILPMPKYDELQESYYSFVNPYTGVLLGVPKSADNLERISVILEALSAESKYTLQPAYYEIALHRKYARDTESSEMLDIIFNTRVYDIGAVYSFGNVYLDFCNIAAKQNRDVVSFYEKNIGKMEKAIDKVVETFRSID